MHRVPEHLHSHLLILLSPPAVRKLDNTIIQDWEYISFWAVCYGGVLAASFLQLSPSACHASAIRHNTAQIMIFGPILPAGTYVSNATSFRLYTETICINMCLHILPNTLPFDARASGKLSMCLQIQMFTLCNWRWWRGCLRERILLMATYKSKRQGLGIDDFCCRIRTY